MSNSRRAQFRFFVGENGTGKTTQMKKFLGINRRNLVFPASAFDKAWKDYETIRPTRVVVDDKRARPGYEKKKYVYRILDINNFSGTRVVDMSDCDDDDDVIDLFMSVIDERTGFVKGGLFIDDFKTYVKSDGSLPHRVKKLLIGYRHRELDCFFACHSFNDINTAFFGHNIVFSLFKSDGAPSADRLRKYKRSEEFLAYYRWVQEAAKKDLHASIRFPPVE